MNEIKQTNLKVGNWYYYAKYKKQFLCVEIGTSKDKTQSTFVDRQFNIYKLYNHDMYNNYYASKHN